MYELTNFASYSLRISMEDQSGNLEEVVYQDFKLDDPVIWKFSALIRKIENG